MTNSITAIYPYQIGTLWVFDDPAVDLREEAFVAGIDKIMDLMTAHIPNAKDGFRLLFSANPFPGANVVMEHIEKDRQTHWPATKWMKKTFIPVIQRGDWYRHAETGMEGWLCPALLKYFDNAPTHIYVKLEVDEGAAERAAERKKQAPRWPAYVPGTHVRGGGGNHPGHSPGQGYQQGGGDQIDFDFGEYADDAPVHGRSITVEEAISEDDREGWWNRARRLPN